MCKRPVLKFFFWIGMLLITSHFLWHFYVFGCSSWQCHKVLFYFRRHISSILMSLLEEIHTWKKNKLSVRSKIVLPKEVLKGRCHHAWMRVAIVNFAREKLPKIFPWPVHTKEYNYKTIKPRTSIKLTVWIFPKWKERRRRKPKTN